MIVYLGLPATGSEQVVPHLPPEVLVGEHLLGPEPLGPADAQRFRPEAAASLTAALAGATGVRLLLPVRRQDRLMEQAHLAEVRRGSAVPFAKQFPHPLKPSLDWADLAERLRAVPGVERIDVLPLDTGWDPLLPVLQALNLPPQPAPEEPPTYSVRGIRVARALNAHLENDAERALVRDFVAATFPGRDSANQFLSATTRARVVEAYAPANRRLFLDWLPGYPDTAWDDFKETS